MMTSEEATPNPLRALWRDLPVLTLWAVPATLAFFLVFPFGNSALQGSLLGIAASSPLIGCAALLLVRPPNQAAGLLRRVTAVLWIAASWFIVPIVAIAAAAVAWRAMLTTGQIVWLLVAIGNGVIAVVAASVAVLGIYQGSLARHPRERLRGAIANVARHPFPALGVVAASLIACVVLSVVPPTWAPVAIILLGWVWSRALATVHSS